MDSSCNVSEYFW